MYVDPNAMLLETCCVFQFFLLEAFMLVYYLFNLIFMTHLQVYLYLFKMAGGGRK